MAKGSHGMGRKSGTATPQGPKAGSTRKTAGIATSSIYKRPGSAADAQWHKGQGKKS